MCVKKRGGEKARERERARERARERDGDGAERAREGKQEGVRDSDTDTPAPLLTPGGWQRQIVIETLLAAPPALPLALTLLQGCLSPL